MATSAAAMIKGARTPWMFDSQAVIMVTPNAKTYGCECECSVSERGREGGAGAPLTGTVSNCASHER